MQQAVSTKPYIVRAIHEWCSDHGHTAYLVVAVTGQMQVPMEYVKNGEIVLNISYNATRNLVLGNDFIRFSARFNGASRDLAVPVGAVVSIFSRETGEGFAFPPEEIELDSAVERPASGKPTLTLAGSEVEETPAVVADAPPAPPPEPPRGGRPTLRVVK